MPSSPKTIVFTRPDAFPGEALRLPGDVNWHFLHLPLIKIEPIDNEEISQSLQRRLDEFDTFIFISKNAVKYACQLLSELTEHLGKPCLAIGPATAEQLQEAGFSNIFFAPGAGGSEELLQQDFLQAGKVNNHRFLIFRGRGGRELLAEQLRARGADVEYIELYTRAQPQGLAEDIGKTWQDRRPEAILVSSAEALHNLLESSPARVREDVLSTPLVVVSERIKNIARSLGFSAAIRVAIGYSDEECMKALKELLEVNK